MDRPSIRKILMTADTLGGVWTYALELSRSLQVYDIDVHLATMGSKLSPSQRVEAAETYNLTLHESEYQLEWMEEPWEDVKKAGEWLLALEEEINPDVIHLNNYVHGSLPWRHPVAMVGHSCVLSWWQAVKNEKAPKEWDVYRQKVKEGLRSADMVIGISNHYLKTLKRLYGPFKNETMIYNGRDFQAFLKRSKADKIFAMGRVWDEAKNLGSLGEVAHQLPWPVVIAGDNKHPGDGKAIDIPNVQFLGKLDKEGIKHELSEAAIFILPAKYEPFGLSALEAALSGCLLVLSDLPTLREIWDDSAFYFDPDDPAALLEKLEWACRRPDSCHEMVIKASKKAQSYSLEKMAEQYIGVYSKLLSTVRQTEVTSNFCSI